MDQSPKDNFGALYEVTQSINSVLEPEPLLGTVLEIAMKHLDAERGFLVLQAPENEKDYQVVSTRNFGDESSAGTFAASSSVVTKVLTSGESVLAFDALSDKEFEASRSIISQKIRSVICVPLRAQDRVTGVVYLDSTTTRGKFNNDTLKFLTVFGHLAAIAIRNARQYQQLRAENERLRNEARSTDLFPELIGKSNAWIRALDVIRRVIDVDASVLVVGESGTGKELVARAIHSRGPRRAHPFVAVNCSAIPDQLMESELFGHRKGAFTGAQSDRAGLVEHANGGTLFLDEIGDLPTPLQAKILRVLQEKEIRRVGDVQDRKVDVRIIAATNKTLQEEVQQGRFREDLYFRLNVISITLPPLRDRRDDIPLLASHFLESATRTHKRTVANITRDAMDALMTQTWHGNARELQNAIERAVVLCRENTITREDLQLDQEMESDFAESGLTLEEFERRIVEKTLQEMGGNRTRTAEKLGVSVRWLQYRLKEWKINA